jgi:hypothetical protein
MRQSTETGLPSVGPRPKALPMHRICGVHTSDLQEIEVEDAVTGRGCLRGLIRVCLRRLVERRPEGSGCNLHPSKQTIIRSNYVPLSLAREDVHVCCRRDLGGVRGGMALFAFGIEAGAAASPVEDSETAVGILVHVAHLAGQPRIWPAHPTNPIAATPSHQFHAPWAWTSTWISNQSIPPPRWEGLYSRSQELSPNSSVL